MIQADVLTDTSTADAHLARDVLCELADGLLRNESKGSHACQVALLNEILAPEACRRAGITPVPADFCLSLIIPVYNEVQTITDVLSRVRQISLPMEIIVVDDGSTDGTREVLEKLDHADDVHIILQEVNRGKGAALRLGFAAARGDVIAIQDGDLEYDPRDLLLLLPPLLSDQADVVYGSRFGFSKHRVSSYAHQRGNQLITRLSNWRTGLRLTDVETCHKVFRRSVIQEITPTLCENRFGVELEITAKLARVPGVRFAERPTSYRGRSYAEGKKIGWRDAVRALWCIMRY